MIIFELILIFSLSLFFINYIMKNAERLGLIDIPNERSSHIKTTPRGAGIGFGAAFFLVCFIFEFSLFINNLVVFISMFLIFLVGILDDYKNTNPKTKFYVMFTSIFLLYLENISIFTLGTYFSYEISLCYLALPFSLFALAGFTNALNLIDGIDGLASLLSIIILGSFAYIGYINNDEFILKVCFFIIISLVAFLFFNWNPACIFMGDSGSLFLGFTISLVAVLSLKYIHPISVFYLSAVPIVDTIVVMVRRIKKGLSPFSPDKTHIHHILLNFFSKNVKKTVLFLSLMQMLFSLVGLMLALNSEQIGKSLASVVALVAFIGITVLFYMIFTGMKKRQKLLEKLKNRKKNHK